MSRSLFTALLVLVASSVFAQRPFTVEDLNNLRRVSDPQASPDGRYVAYVLAETDMEANRRRTDLWLLDLHQKDPEPRRLTQHNANDSSPRWSADSRWIYFLSTRSGSSQVWRLPLAGGEATQVTHYPLDVGSLKVAPQGNRIAITMEVLPDCDTLECTQKKLEAEEKSKPTGQLYDRIFVRHWDAWKNGTRSHLFIAEINADGVAGTPVDISKTLDADVPSKPFGGDDEFAFSPDGQRIVFAARVAKGNSEPWSTNFDLFEAPVDGSSAPKNLTEANEAWDTNPVFLRNGDLAYLAMSRPGFEADRFRVMLRDARTGATREVAPDWDRSAGQLGVSADGRRLLATADDLGQHPLFEIRLNGKPRAITPPGQTAAYTVVGDSVVFVWSTIGAPPDLYVQRLSGGTPRPLTKVNEDLLRDRSLGEFEQFAFAGWNGETVHGYVVKPFGFTEGGRFPVAFIVHGGPQVSFANQWNWRWNAQAFAGAGFGVVFIDYHGSPGYGQAFTDSISLDWGGKPLEDLQKGLAAALEKYPWLDGERACALGASYGGFMMNWIAGQWPERFRCLVNHAGVFDQRSMYYSTEELWFPEWDFGGPYFEKPENYEKFNPANFVSRWRTPMLVSHGALDYRVPYTQGISAFTALQRRGTESRLLFFPDENHWVLKPANSNLWYQTAIDWLKAHLGQ